MTEQTSRLAIVIDSTGAERQADNLATALNRMTQSGNNAADSGKKVTKATTEEKEALSQLLDRIDPVNAALNKLDKQQQELARFKAKGFIDTETFDLYSKKIEDAHKNLTGFNDGMKNGTITAGQYKQAMRQLPAQFTDIFTSIAGGMPLWLIFTQQGGQIADSFGGWSALLDVIKREVLGFSDATDESSDSLSDNANGLAENADHLKQFSGLLTPTRLALGGVAAAVGLLTFAYYQGSKEQDAFNESLILTGNIVGKTSGQLAYMATAIADNAGSTISMSSDVLNQLVAGGKVAASTLASASEAIIKLNDATGISTSQLVSDFEAIAGSPVEAIGKLNDQYHFLTLATYNQIRALQEEGNQQESAKVASDAYSAAISQKADDIKASLGTLQTAWNDLGDAAKWAWDQMLDIGRESSLEQRLGTLEETLADAKAKQKEGGLWNRFSANASGYNIPEMEKQVAALKSQITAQNVLNDSISSFNQRQQKAIEAQKYVNSLAERTKTNAQKRAQEQAALTRKISEGAILSAEEEARIRKNIDEKYKDPKVPKTPKGKAYTEDAATRLLDQLNQQTVALQSQLVVDDKLSSVTQQRIKFEQQIADIKTKKQLTADQKSILSRSDEILQAYKAQEAIGNQVKTLDDYRKMQLTVNNNDKAANNLLIERLKLLDKAKVAGATDTQGTREQLLRTAPNKPPSAVTSVTGGLTPKDGSLSGSWGGMQQQMQQLQQAQQALDLWQQQSLQSYQAYYQGRVDLTTEYEQQIANVKQQYAQQSQAIDTQSQVIQTTAIQSTMDSIVDITKTGFGEKSAIYKVAFAADKAYAIAQSLVSIQSGIAMAAANPFPYNLVAMASVAAATASIVSNISSVAGVGFMSGGYTGGASIHDVRGVVHGKEFVFDAAATKKIGVSNLEALRNGKPLDATLGKSGFGTGAQNVSNSSQKTVNNFTANLPPVTINGNPSDATIQLVQQAAKTGAEQGYKRMVNDIATGRGEAHKALVGGYNTSRRTG
jgi:lambda family phage tail tape measure protein